MRSSKPADDLEAKFSLQHWVAASALYGAARLDEGRSDVVRDQEVQRLRAATHVTTDPQMAFDAAAMTVELKDGRRLETSISHCVGSVGAPMQDSDIEAKFIAQAKPGIGYERAVEAARMYWDVERLPDVSALARLVLSGSRLG